MSDCLGLSGPRSARSGSSAAETPSMTILMYSGCFVNLKIAADKLFKGAAAETDLNSADDKLKKLREHIRLLEEKLLNAFNEEAKLKMKQKDDEKLWETLESEFSSTMTMGDQFIETLLRLQRLVDQVQDAAKEDKDCFEVEMSTSLGALGILNNLLKSHFKRLVVSSKWAVKNSDKMLRKPNMPYFKDETIDCGIDVIGASMIDIKTNNMFQSQLNIARMTNSLVVILFYKGNTQTWKSVLLPFADLTDNYWTILGDKISFLTVDLKSIRKMFKVKTNPTAVVIKGDDREEVGRINKTVFVPTFITKLRKVLDDWIKCHYGVEAKDLLLDDCFF